MPPFEIVSDFKMTGDQPQAVDGLVTGLNQDFKHQTLLGVTGSGKTFTMANVITRVQRPTLVICHNKTLAAQLCAEFKEFSFELEIDGSPFDPSREDFDLSIRDSNHSFFCGGKFNLRDHSSVFQEYRMLNDGMPFNAGFSYQDEDAVLTTSFIVDRYNGKDNLQFGVLSPRIEAFLNHANANILNVQSKAYPGTISDVIPELLSDLDFEEILVLR